MPNNTMNPSTDFINSTKVGIKLTTVNYAKRFNMQNGTKNISFANGGMNVVLYGANDGKIDTSDVKAKFTISKAKLRNIKRTLDVIKSYPYNSLLKVIRQSENKRINIASSAMTSEVAWFLNIEEINFDPAGRLNMTLSVKSDGKWVNYNNGIMPLLMETKNATPEYKNLIRSAPGIRGSFMMVLMEMCDTTTGLHLVSLSNYANEVIKGDVDITPDEKPFKQPMRPKKIEPTPQEADDLDNFLDGM